MKHETDGYPVPREEKILETIAKSKELYFQAESRRLLTYQEFLWQQLQYTRKRWWTLQTALLLSAFLSLPFIKDHSLQIRSFGVVGCLFVIFIIPELWRNRECDSTQVEAACLFSLRQVYAARITLFGLVDTVLLTLFCLGLGWMGFSLADVFSHFLFPVTVTACICFGLLGGSGNRSEAFSLAACLTWSGVWWLILRNEAVYQLIVPTVWIALLGIAFLFLIWAVRRAIRTTNQTWEVDFTCNYN